MSERILISADCVAEGARWLARTEPAFARALEATGPWPDRRRPGGFEALVDAIVSQQLSVASAAAIGKRVREAGLNLPDTIRAASDEDLRGVGLSGPKMRYLRALSEAGIDFEALEIVPTPTVIATLTAVPGIGRWTAEIYALFSLGRADAFPAGDLALQESARALFGLEERPREAALRRLAEPWSPWRGVAALGLWAYYRVAKGREGTT